MAAGKKLEAEGFKATATPIGPTRSPRGMVSGCKKEMSSACSRRLEGGPWRHKDKVDGVDPNVSSMRSKYDETRRQTAERSPMRDRP